MLPEIRRGLMPPNLERKYQQGLGMMLDHIMAISPDMIFYPGDSASRMADELELTARVQGLTLPPSVKVSHDVNRSLYCNHPLERVDMLKTLVSPDQEILLAEDTARFGDKLIHYDNLFRIAGFTDMQYVVLTVGRWFTNDEGLSLTILLEDQALYDYLMKRRMD